ncbi:hypothetical protein [Pseudoalteromonas luteoviolacea]|uniref:hypothetical protein n=1 Tax=Pseudoalteromonas luteoviolacea TaxID=43657 RepID=UPI001B3676E3|nr:hypothetical protein [Pseudoalteromonas luteoviolacea]MBQ4838807.1 hypothetical protein [Pseudoalteromonas luteoviolacea]
MRKLFAPVPHPRPLDYIYDNECYPNFFSCSIKHSATGTRYRFVISEWCDDGQRLALFLQSLSNAGAYMVGFNNTPYDYVLLHLIMQTGGVITNADLYAKSQAIISDRSGFGHTIWMKDRFVKQIDLLKIHHFDNAAKYTSLKVLEINMRAKDVRDLPFDPTKPITREQGDVLLSYNDHDVDETEQFYFESLDAIAFRQDLADKYPNKDWLNFSDTKIGSEVFIRELESQGVPTKFQGVKLQTPRNEIRLRDVIFPYVQFEQPEFNRIKQYFEQAVINPKQIKGFFSNLTAIIDGFDFDFGAGGIHGSLHKTIVRSTDTHDLIDVDVASYYPNLAIANNLFPAHLSETFCDVYLGVYNQRKTFKKGTVENAMLKLALNGVYGNSNNEHSVFYDPQYTMSITINGQLLLCMLAEWLMKIPGLSMVQINTDGMTFLCPKEYRTNYENMCKHWENVTRLELEHVDYKAMYIRDVNSYMAETLKGKVKRIGAYAWERAAENPGTREVPWHKDHSSLVIQKAAQAALIDNVNIREFITNHADDFDFIITTKVPRSSKLEIIDPVYWGDDHVCDRTRIIQSTSRCYVSKTGGALTKIMPPTATQIGHWKTGDHYQHINTGDYKVVKPGQKPPSGMYSPVINPDRSAPKRRIGLMVGYKMRECNGINDFHRSDVDYEYYINEARKLVDALIEGETRCAA